MTLIKRVGFKIVTTILIEILLLSSGVLEGLHLRMVRGAGGIGIGTHPILAVTSYTHGGGISTLVVLRNAGELIHEGVGRRGVVAFLLDVADASAANGLYFAGARLLLLLRLGSA